MGCMPQAYVHDHYSRTFFSLKLLCQPKQKFHVQPPFGVGTRFYINGPGHMIKMTQQPCSYKKKTFKKPSSLEPEVLWSWNLACSIRDFWGLPSLYKWWSWVDLDLFYGKVKFGCICFCIRKIVTMSFKGKTVKHLTRLTEDLRFLKTIWP